MSESGERWFVHARLDEEAGTLVLADIPGRDHDIVADCWDGGSVNHDTAARRARLIAAAPELLAALDEIVDALQSGYVPAANGEVIRAARAAIAKATGDRAIAAAEPTP